MGDDVLAQWRNIPPLVDIFQEVNIGSVVDVIALALASPWRRGRKQYRSSSHGGCLDLVMLWLQWISHNLSFGKDF